MGLFDKIKKYLAFSSETASETRLYCQSCGNDLTNQGGDVSGSGKIYCHGYREDGGRCVTDALFKGVESGSMFFNFYEAAKLSRAIKRGKLSNFGPLEEKVNRRLVPTKIIAEMESGSLGDLK